MNNGDAPCLRSLSWGLPNRLAAAAAPQSEHGVDALLALGLTHILNLAFTPIPLPWLGHKPLEQTHIPIKADDVLTKAEMDIVYDRVQAGGVWVVCCEDGVGMSGMVLACLVAMLGEEASDSLAERGQNAELVGR